MFDTLLKMKDAIVLYLVEQNLDRNETLNDHDWKLMLDVTTVLRPLYLFTLEISGEKNATLSKVIPMVNILLDEYSSTEPNETKMVKDCRQLIHDALKKQFDGIESQDTYVTSTILDPRFKNVGFSNKNKLKAVNQAKYLVLSMAHGDKTDENIEDFSDEDDGESSNTKVQVEFNDLWKKFDAKKVVKRSGSRGTDYFKDAVDMEMKKFLSFPKIPRQDCPILWWKKEGSSLYPLLYEAAKKYVPMIATSCPSERAFSAAGNILTQRRNKLSKTTANMLISLHTNLV